MFSQLCLSFHSIFKIEACITEIKLQASLVLFRLHLVAVKAVNLLTQISHGIVVLHAKSGQCSFLSNFKFFKLSLDSSKFCLTFLVELNLSGCVRASFLKTRFNIFLKHGAAFLSLCPRTSFNIEFFIKLFKSCHQ